MAPTVHNLLQVTIFGKHHTLPTTGTLGLATLATATTPTASTFHTCVPLVISIRRTKRFRELRIRDRDSTGSADGNRCDTMDGRGSSRSSVSGLGLILSLGLRSSWLTLGGSSRLGVAVIETALVSQLALASVPKREAHLI